MADITLDELTAIMPKISVTAEGYLPYMNAAMDEGLINTPLRQAAWLGQIAVESVQLRYMLEVADGSAYEGRKDLGNIYPGDGVKYKGRGPIQITGRKNYTACGIALGLDLVNHPEILEQVDQGFRGSVWYWVVHGLNQLADIPDYHQITYRINGGYTDWLQRLSFYTDACNVLGANIDWSDVTSGSSSQDL